MRAIKFSREIKKQDAGRALDQQARDFALENRCGYPESLDFVMDDPANAELVSVYTNTEMLVKTYTAQENAGREIDRKAKVLMLKYNLSYREGFEHVLNDERNADVVHRYLGK